MHNVTYEITSLFQINNLLTMTLDLLICMHNEQPAKILITKHLLLKKIEKEKELTNTTLY